MKLTLHPYQLRFKYPFKISHGIRAATDVVYVKLQHGSFTAWGEATLPPYLPETQASVMKFLSAIDLNNIQFPLDPAAIFDAIDARYTGNMSAKAALDMAIWSLKAQMEDKSITTLLDIEADNFPLCTYTLGVSAFDEMKVKVEEAILNGFQLFKIKLNGEYDKEMVSNFRKLNKAPFAVDVNQGWKALEEAKDKIKWLRDEGCILVEQPLHRDAVDEMRALKELAILTIYADESCQRLNDIDRLTHAFDGINVKLMKCGGITEARRMIIRARELDMKILVGCMSESSVGCTAAANLTPCANYADLDGPYLIGNDPFTGMRVQQGRITLHDLKCTSIAF